MYCIWTLKFKSLKDWQILCIPSYILCIKMAIYSALCISMEIDSVAKLLKEKLLRQELAVIREK